jgi:hypothetical protein
MQRLFLNARSTSIVPGIVRHSGTGNPAFELLVCEQTFHHRKESQGRKYGQGWRGEPRDYDSQERWDEPSRYYRGGGGANGFGQRRQGGWTEDMSLHGPNGRRKSG